eukprot:GHUV01054741.1.p2 GENE.GHUV01054741.1~~GHUV01054741.1.p2  ORF type:complete len:108 (+),score=5.60 GHUV01054741.1:360-683(+)
MFLREPAIDQLCSSTVTYHTLLSNVFCWTSTHIHSKLRQWSNQARLPNSQHSWYRRAVQEQGLPKPQLQHTTLWVKSKQEMVQPAQVVTTHRPHTPKTACRCLMHEL